MHGLRAMHVIHVKPRAAALGLCHSLRAVAVAQSLVGDWAFYFASSAFYFASSAISIAFRACIKLNPPNDLKATSIICEYILIE